MPIETEIKFSVPDDATLEAIGAIEEIAGYEVVHEGLKAHRDIYFDTAGRTLFSGKAVLRLREKGSGKVLTFKAQSPGSSAKTAIYRRTEVECACCDSPDDIIAGNSAVTAPLEALRKRFGDLALEVSMTADNRRRVFLLKRDNQAAFELVLDDVTFSGPNGTRRVLEIEVESIVGSDDDLDLIGAVLSGRFALAPAGPSKYILGMELVGRTT